MKIKLAAVSLILFSLLVSAVFGQQAGSNGSPAVDKLVTRNRGQIQQNETTTNGTQYFFLQPAASLAATIGFIWPSAASTGCLKATNSGGTMTLSIQTCGDAGGAGDGTAGAPTFSFASDPDTGLFSAGANDLGFATGGTQRVDISTTACTSTLPWLGPNGTVGAPAVSFASDPDTGLYRIGANNLGVAVAGAKVLDVSATGLGVTGDQSASGHQYSTPTPVTIADSGNGSTATSTLTTPASDTYLYTCSDADGCDLTLGETSVTSGQILRIVNYGSANVLNISDSAGISETTGAIALGRYDSIVFVYASDRWVELSSSNN